MAIPAAFASQFTCRRGSKGIVGWLCERNEGATEIRPIELFFDLGFVFAFAQVTGLLSDRLTWTGML